jgi:3-deoxy-D-arabino-heptulosonate 7-phosphate (DAHP) synthase class II
MLNPLKRMGKIVMMSGMDADTLPLKLSGIINALREEPVLWVCHPMASGFRTIQTFFRVCHLKNIQPHGVYLDVSSSNITDIETAFFIADLLRYRGPSWG